jgi:hypothetical protein
MSLVLYVLRLSLPVLLGLLVLAVALNHVLQFLFKLVHWPNYSSASPSGPLSWTRLAPADILFRLAWLGALNLILYWLPVFYWTTYTPSGDERDGGVLFYSMAFCPASWVLGVLCYAQVWRARFAVSRRYRLGFCIASSMLLMVILSTCIPQVSAYVRMSRV